MKHWVCGLLLTWLMMASAQAHWASPGYLELKQNGEDTYSVLWKVPLQAGRPLDLGPLLPDNCVDKTPVSPVKTATAVVERWITLCEGGLTGRSIQINGLPTSLTDVLARVNHMDGTVQTVRLTPGDPAFAVTATPDWIDVSTTYLVLGIEHILSGIDHLLFVLALLIIVSGWRRLVVTVTAFTVAHSITLGAAALGWVYMPRPPVEAVIALSILFLAVEIVHRARGRMGITERAPWVVAFTFGLLHGFGFAGALTEVGLPHNAIPLALLFFNIGVELGQLLFVGAFLLLTWVWMRVSLNRGQWMEVSAAYIIGCVAAYWTIERVVGFWT